MSGKSTAIPTDYADWLADIKTRVATARQRAALAANAELIQLYWQIGRDILQRQSTQGWGSKVIERLARDLREAFPEMKGFSARNLKYMRAFAEAWPDAEFVQQPAAQLPWFHLCTLIDKLKDPALRLYYADLARTEGWSRTTLELNIRNRLHEPEVFVRSQQKKPSALQCFKLLVKDRATTKISAGTQQRAINQSAGFMISLIGVFDNRPDR